jgi:hypothetical protein
MSNVPFADLLHLPPDYRPRRVTRHGGIGAGETATLMDVRGAGCISHIWITASQNDYRRVVLRMYWDDAESPQVEAPLTDFFGVGHNMRVPGVTFATPLLAVASVNGYNTYFPMPFARRARITLTNEQDAAMGGGFYFQADYREYDMLPEATPRFCAKWRREAPALRRARPYTVLQAAGDGFIAGMTYHVGVEDDADAWYHGGGDLVLLDAEDEPVLIHGIGGEDYFGASWGIGPFVSPYTGCTLDADGQLSMYRFYTGMPLRFRRSARLAFQCMANEITSVGYWYQAGPVHPFWKLPEPDQRVPDSRCDPHAHDIELLPDRQLDVAVAGPFAGNLETALPPDAGLDINETYTTQYANPYGASEEAYAERQVRWERARTTLGWLDFGALYKPKFTLEKRHVQVLRPSVVYALVALESDQGRRAQLHLGHDERVRVTVNGEVVAELPRHEGHRASCVELPLRNGRNEVLLKIAHDANTNWFAAAISLWLPESDGLRCKAFAQLPPSPEYPQPAVSDAEVES